MGLSRILLLSAIFISAHTRFFDVCPSRRLSIGACLAGLCPAGSECINGYCCKVKTTTPSTQDISVEENEEFGRCKNGRHAIGECISESCPNGFKCENGLCCKPGLPPVRVTMIPVETEVTKKKFTPATVDSTTESATMIPEAESEETTTHEETEIESIKKAFKKKKEEDEDSDTTDEYVETTTIEEELGVAEREEVDDVTTTTERATTQEETTPSPTTTTEAPSTIGSRRRLKTRRPLITTTMPTTTESWTNSEEHWTTTTERTTTEADIDSVDTGCPVGEPIGECVSNHCPEGHACFHNSCCILTPQINCTDTLVSCMPHLCNKRGYKEFMTKSCARTCARCHLTELDNSELRECRDRRNDCNEWAEEGFCDSTLYTTRQKLKFCGKSCKLC